MENKMKSGINELSLVEMISINGGAPSADTSFGYDVGYCLMKFFKPYFSLKASESEYWSK